MESRNKMMDMKLGRISDWRSLSATLAIFRLAAENGGRFPPFVAGQYIALRRDDCLLTKKVKEGNDVQYVPDLDADGRQKRGPVTHSYSIASAPFEAAVNNYLEFYMVLERDVHGDVGRFTESLFRRESEDSDRLSYLERIAGNFTLARRAAGFEHVLMVATGTGLAPFVSMVKQLHFEAQLHGPNHKRYTLFHANRTYEELAYHRQMIAIEASKAFDFVYVRGLVRTTPVKRLCDPRGIPSDGEGCVKPQTTQGWRSSRQPKKSGSVQLRRSVAFPRLKAGVKIPNRPLLDSGVLLDRLRGAWILSFQTGSRSQGSITRAFCTVSIRCLRAVRSRSNAC